MPFPSRVYTLTLPASAPFADTTGIVQGSADPTKQLRFEVDGFTAGQTRVATFPDANITVARTDAAQEFAGNQTFTGDLILTAAGNKVITNGGGGFALQPFGQDKYTFQSNGATFKVGIPLNLEDQDATIHFGTGYDARIKRTATKTLTVDDAAGGAASLNVIGVFKVGGTQVIGAQGAAVADPVDEADAVIQLSALLARCRAHGFIAT